MNDRAEDLAYGRWPEILEHAGIDATCFNGKHGPCPLCGGKDRFRWTNKNGGLWVCSGCTEDKYANGFRMLMEHLTLDFRGAADYVRGYFNGTGVRSGVMRKPKPESAADNAERNRQRMERFWAGARAIIEGDPVWRYLHHRVPGLSFQPQWLRFHPSLEYWQRPEDPDGKPVLLGRYPAMLAKAFDVHGRFVQLHKTYLTADGRKADVPIVKKTDLGVGVNGFAVPLQPVVGDTLGFAEGIESALAGSMVRGIPVWPCLNGPSMASFAVPEKLLGQINCAVIFADNDERRDVRVTGSAEWRKRSAGLHYAEQLAKSIRAQGKRVLIVKAARVGYDMANYWESSHRAALA